VEAAEDPDRDSAAVGQAEEREAERARAGVEARAAAEACGKRGKPQAEAVVGVLVEAEELVAQVAVVGEPGPAVEVARVREPAVAEDLEALVEGLEVRAEVVGEPGPAVEGDLEGRVEDQEALAAVVVEPGQVVEEDSEARAVVEGEPGQVVEEDLVEVLEVAGQVEEAEDRVEALAAVAAG
jgi:hypothetical protein